MITQNISISVDSGLAPYTYYFQSTDPCIQFETITGSTSETIIENSYNVRDAACLDTATISVTIYTADGCSTTLDIPVSNPCENFRLDPIVRVSDYEFSVSASRNGCSSLNFTWTYNTDSFVLDSINNSQYASVLSLEPKPNILLPDTILVSVTTEDCNGCRLTTSRSFPICKPTISAKTVVLNCISDVNAQLVNYISAYEQFDVTSNCNVDIDWSTLIIDYPEGISEYIPRDPSEVSVVYTDQFVKFFAENVEPGTYEGTWVVKDENGVTSNTAPLFFVVNECDTPSAISITPIVFEIACDSVQPGEFVDIPFSASINTTLGVSVDWSTFQVLTNPVPYVPLTNIVLYTDVQGDKYIRYTTVNPILSDFFKVTVQDTTGNIISSPTSISVGGCSGYDDNNPVANNDVYCAVCSESIVMDVLTNDTSETNGIDPSTVVLDNTSSLQGTLNVNANGTITYTAPANFNGTEQFGYRVTDNAGLISNIATVTIDVICAGGDAQTVVCEY